MSGNCLKESQNQFNKATFLLNESSKNIFDFKKRIEKTLEVIPSLEDDYVISVYIDDLKENLKDFNNYFSRLYDILNDLNNSYTDLIYNQESLKRTCERDLTKFASKLSDEEKLEYQKFLDELKK